MALEIQISKTLPSAQPARITKEQGAHLNTAESATLRWIVRYVGGDITILKTKQENGIKSPDLKINKTLVEIKNTSGNLGTLDKHMRQAAKQTRGGMAYVDITGASYEDVEAITIVANRMLRSGLSEAILIRAGKLVARIILTKENR